MLQLEEIFKKRSFGGKNDRPSKNAYKDMMFDFNKCKLVEIDESKEYHCCNLFYFSKEKIKKNFNSMGINTDESMKD